MVAAEKKRILFWGGKDKAKILVRMLDKFYSETCEIIGIFDPKLAEPSFRTQVDFHNSQQGLKELLSKASHFVTCIGEHNRSRYEISEKLVESGLTPLNLINPSSVIDVDDVSFVGVQVMPQATIHMVKKIGKYCIFNTNSTVDHDCIIGDAVNIMGGVSIAGNVMIGRFSSIGTNATILPGIKIGENSYVGAGAVVTKNIGDNEVFMGVPARFYRNIYPNWDTEIFNKL